MVITCSKFTCSSDRARFNVIILASLLLYIFKKSHKYQIHFNCTSAPTQWGLTYCTFIYAFKVGDWKIKRWHVTNVRFSVSNWFLIQVTGKINLDRLLNSTEIHASEIPLLWFVNSRLSWVSKRSEHWGLLERPLRKSRW